MPKAQKEALRKVARKYIKQGKMRVEKGETKEQATNRFVYGTINKQGKK